MRIHNIKKYKSTVLGLVFMAVGIVLLLKNITTDYWIIGSLEIGGLLLFFTGDRFIENLEKTIFGKVLFENKKGCGNEVE